MLSPAGMAPPGALAGRHVRLPVADGAQSVELVVQEILHGLRLARGKGRGA